MRSLWEEFVRSRAFWESYVAAAASFTPGRGKSPGWPICGATITLSLPSDYMLCIEVGAGEHWVRLGHSDFEDYPLVGTVDAQQMSDLFRWDEFRAVVRGVAAENAGPRWAHQLLLIFYVAVTEDCAAAYLSLLRRCLEQSRAFTAKQTGQIIASSRRSAVRRVQTPKLGWVAEGRDAYSMRHTGGSFDFAAFRGFLAAVVDRP